MKIKHLLIGMLCITLLSCGSSVSPETSDNEEVSTSQETPDSTSEEAQIQQEIELIKQESEELGQEIDELIETI